MVQLCAIIVGQTSSTLAQRIVHMLWAGGGGAAYVGSTCMGLHPCMFAWVDGRGFMIFTMIHISDSISISNEYKLMNERNLKCYGMVVYHLSTCMLKSTFYIKYSAINNNGKGWPHNAFKKPFMLAKPYQN